MVRNRSLVRPSSGRNSIARGGKEGYELNEIAGFSEPKLIWHWACLPPVGTEIIVSESLRMAMELPMKREVPMSILRKL